MTESRRVKIVDTTFRDAHQSLLATRMRTEDMLPIGERIDKIGFYSLEVWGGATFDVCIRYLNQDPWERLRTLKRMIPNTPMQMLLRGQNLVGYRHYPDDVVKEFIRLARKNGVDIFRIFDALNDLRNMEVSIKTAKASGAHVQGAICYTISPVHTIENFVKFGKELEKLGCNSICIKDMAGLISPQAAFDLVKALKKEIGIPIDLHTHCTSGMGPLSYFSACEAGVDIIDTAFSPFAGGTSQPATEIIVASLNDTSFSTGLDLQTLIEIGYYFLKVRQKYGQFISPLAEKPDTSVLIHQIPGGMLSNLHSQLKEQKALDKYQEVLEETPRVRKDLGYPPLVTPTSQIVGIQAVINVLTGKRYERVTKEVKDYCLGYYGRPPGPIDEDLKKKIIGDEKPIDFRPADRLKPELDNLRSETKAQGLLRHGHEDEDLITYALYPKVAPKFLKGEAEQEIIQVTTEPEARPDELKVAAITAALAKFLRKEGSRFITTETKSALSPWKLAGLHDGLR
ncbi:MAG: pyruvate/oxaloacetate carboxyltransferase [candidate division WOR-3 bacterium]|nr:pyruvate/oxaloacetate carboxyltransferase [candidate division WOR-3 bacterium]